MSMTSSSGSTAGRVEAGEAARSDKQQQTTPPPPPPLPLPQARTGGFLGRHRLSAAITRLDQEILSLQEEINELETMDPSSAACQEGPEDVSWDRWFQRVRSSRGHKWWTHKGSDFS
ncbi:guanine nucleotide-binding protein subunit gamma 2-like isoform X4 [Ananas comosus]|uniref:Guanine nucleotide-binding protein subunit gamma 2-like isoform X4 n=1 Tax=Ananas comosus TaxID=4615 RepID=A0A6P5F623_ANACO|nr:guanine nucleotide-binding protein subunit gamma 2-like isoform X4 [Ananas comosus]